MEKRLSVLDGILPITWILLGGFHEYVSCIASVILSAYLIIRLIKSKRFRIQIDWLTAAVTFTVLGYGVTCLWAVDSGMAFIGFVKFLPLLLYLLSLHQAPAQDGALRWMPYAAAVLTVVSVIGMQITAVASWFSVADRLAGTFQYPNSFAMFLLIAELLLFKQPAKKWYDIVAFAVLVGGLLYTGSRTVFVLAVLSNIAMALLTVKRARMKQWLVGGCVAMAVVAIAVVCLAQTDVLSRYLTIDFTQSTFVGRLLYMVDALPLLLRYPFGMGYMGYYYTQTAVQSGVYSVAFVHNDWLQIALDVGLVPCLLWLTTIGMFLFSKKNTPAEKVIVTTFALHGLLDFDLQFIGMFLLLVLMLYRPRTMAKDCRCLYAALVGIAVLGATGLYMGAALFMPCIGQYEAAEQLYAFNTQNKLGMLAQEEDVDAAYTLAEEIASQNESCYVPYSIRASYAFSTGDITRMIENEREALRLAPFEYQEYETYAIRLIQLIEAYRARGDGNSAALCQQELRELQRKLSALPDEMSYLGTMIDDQPITEFPDEIVQYIERMEGDG